MSTLFCGGTLLSIDPISFIQNPILWPMCIEKYEATGTAGPNFGYALAGRKLREKNIKFNMTSLKIADVAAEPIQMTTIESMKSDWNIQPTAIFHSYGMAECGVWTSSAPSFFDPDTGVAVSADLEYSQKFNTKLIVGDRNTSKCLPDTQTGGI
jgi:fatty-acyl-CoA synthase